MKVEVEAFAVEGKVRESRLRKVEEVGLYVLYYEKQEWIECVLFTKFSLIFVSICERSQ